VPPLGALRGEIDEVGRRRICGWAQDVARPEASVCLDIHAGGGLIGQVVANRYRADLAAAGLDSGRHGFEFVPPPGLAFTPRSIQVRRSLEDASLTCSKTLKQSVARRPRNTSAR
jgi:O-antigen biosynthesis protein